MLYIVTADDVVSGYGDGESRTEGNQDMNTAFNNQSGSVSIMGACVGTSEQIAQDYSVGWRSNWTIYGNPTTNNVWLLCAPDVDPENIPGNYPEDYCADCWMEFSIEEMLDAGFLNNYPVAPFDLWASKDTREVPYYSKDWQASHSLNDQIQRSAKATLEIWRTRCTRRAAQERTAT